MDPCKTKTIKLAIQPKWYSKSLDWYNQKANSREGASEPEIAPKTAQATAILCTRTRSRRSVAPRRIVRGRRVRRRYLAGALEVVGVGRDEGVGGNVTDTHDECCVRQAETETEVSRAVAMHACAAAAARTKS